MAGEINGAFACMRIGAVFGPAVLLAFVDGTGLMQHIIAQPRSVRMAGRLSFVISIEITPAEDESLCRRLVPGA
jgi:hypothetical protein